MALRLLPWAPEYGSGVQADTDGGDADVFVDTAVEGPWAAVRPAPDPADAGRAPAVQIVDGVRRVEAHALVDLEDGGTAPGLFGSYAVGAVHCSDSHAGILEGERTLRVERRYLQAGGEPDSRELTAGTATLHFRAEVPPRATNPNDLVAALNRLMLDEEAKLAEELSLDESVLTLVDGPLRLRSAGRRVVGYVKRTHRWYIGVAEQQLLIELRVGERTPLFRLADPDGDATHDRYAWFVRSADVGARYHPLAGVVRLEASASLPMRDAARLADQSALVLPRLASTPARDPRAPQNLTPVGALEAVLTRRLGDRRWLRRRIADTLGEPDVGAFAADEPVLAAAGGAPW